MLRKLMRTLVLSVVLAAVTPTAANAAPTRLTVTNLAQPGLESELPQPPVTSLARGSCDTPFSAHEANTGLTHCGPGSWPADDGNWGPEVAVAGGDRLTLSFDSPPHQVRYAATTRFPRGLLDPAGQPYPNKDAITARDAQPSADPRVWIVDLPRFEGLETAGHSPWSGYTLPIVARTADEWRNFAASIRSPRPMRYGRSLCDFYTNPGEFFPGCVLPPGGRPVDITLPDRRAPVLKVRVPGGQRFLNRRGVLAFARCDEPCALGLSGRVRVGRRSYKLRNTRKAAPAGKRIRIRARLTPRGLRTLRSTSRGHRRARAVLVLRARDAAGNPSRFVRRTIALRRP